MRCVFLGFIGICSGSRGLLCFLVLFFCVFFWVVLSVACWRDWVRLRGAADWERRGLMWRVFFEMALWGFLTAKVTALSV